MNPITVVLASVALLCCTSALRATTPQERKAGEPTDPYQQAQAKFAAQDYAGAETLYRSLLKANPYASEACLGLAVTLYSEKKYEEAIPVFQKANAYGARREADNLYDIACCYALAGKKTEALHMLEQAIAKGFPSLDHLREDADLKSLHDDPKFQEIAAQPDTSKMARVEGWRYDLSLLAREIERVHYAPFGVVSREKFEAFVRKLHNDIPKLSDTQVAVGLMRLLRMVGDGHTTCQLRDAQFDRIGAKGYAPVQFYLFEEGLYIIAAEPKNADLVGAKVVRFGSHSVEETMQALDSVVSQDNTIWVKQIGPMLMRAPHVLNGLGLIPSADCLPLTIEGTDGQERTVTLAAEASAKEPTAEWITAHKDAPTPLTLKNRQAPYWFEYLPDSKTVFFAYNAVQDDPKEPLDRFCERLFKFIADNDVERLALDMRWNGGGNNFLNRPILEGLIRCDKINRRGRLFVIVGRNTFSAAMCGATQFERYTNALFVGEPTGSRPNFIGETNRVVLPYSKIRASISNLYWQNSVAMDYRTWIAPALYAPPTFASYKSGQDPAMDAILAYGKPEGDAQ